MRPPSECGSAVRPRPGPARDRVPAAARPSLATRSRRPQGPRGTPAFTGDSGLPATRSPPETPAPVAAWLRRCPVQAGGPLHQAGDGHPGRPGPHRDAGNGRRPRHRDSPRGGLPAAARQACGGCSDRAPSPSAPAAFVRACGRCRPDAGGSPGAVACRGPLLAARQPFAARRRLSAGPQRFAGRGRAAAGPEPFARRDGSPARRRRFATWGAAARPSVSKQCCQEEIDHSNEYN